MGKLGHRSYYPSPQSKWSFKHAFCFCAPSPWLYFRTKLMREAQMYSKHTCSKGTEGLPRWHSGKELACQCRRCKRYRFSQWVRNIPWRRKWQPTPVFLLGESPWTGKLGRLQSMGSQQNRTQLSSGNSGRDKKSSVYLYRPFSMSASIHPCVYLHIKW